MLFSRRPRSKSELEKQLAYFDAAWWNGLPQGRENLYVCDKCRSYLHTIDIDRGVTPMVLACKASEECRGSMISAGYPKGPKPSHLHEPDWEWYRPEVNALGRFDNDDMTEEHILRGGLLLRGRNDAP